MDAEKDKPEENTWASRVSNLVSEKMKDGFYGYLLAAFAIHNWQQIFILFKSKKPIEETLHNLVSQPDFALHSFWIPLAWGVGASFVMPWIMVGYVYLLAKTRSLMASAQDEANEIRASQLRIKQERRRAEEIKASNEKEILLQDIRDTHAELLSANKALADKQKKIEDFEVFLSKLNFVYTKNMPINNADDFRRFFEEALNNQVFLYYPNIDISRGSSGIVRGANTPSSKASSSPPKE